jgi:shikimate kinase
MQNSPSNIVLIGMPGSGKSTVGVILAKKTARAFVDTDVLIQTAEKRSLQDIVDAEGYDALRAIEAELLANLSVANHVIATGGSAVYSDRAMNRLKTDGIIVFLDADLATLKARVGDFSTRGLARRPEQSFADLFEERLALYQKHADITVNCAQKSQEAVCDEIIAAVAEKFPPI